MTSAEDRLPTELRRLAWALMALAALSLVYTAAMTRVAGTPHPYGVTLFPRDLAGTDFTVFGERSRHFGTAGYWDELNYPFTYPAPLAVVFAVLFRLPHPLAIYLGMCVAGLAAWAVWLARGLAATGVRLTDAFAFPMIIVAASWPVVALFNTGNIEGLLAIVLAAGTYAVLRERFWLGATLIGLAASMKLYPFILLALLLSRRRWKEFAWGVGAAALTTVASLALLGPGVREAQQHIDSGLGFVRSTFILSTQREALNFSHSLFSPVKFGVVLIARALGLVSASLLERTLNVYSAAAAIFGVAIYFLRIRKLPMLNQLIALTVCAVLLPPLSADYTLLQLLLPLGLLCVYAAVERGNTPAGLGACFICFAWIFAWETFLTVKYSFDRPVRALALSALLVVVLRHPFAWPELDSRAARVSL